jgi:hypothetical protein
MKTIIFSLLFIYSSFAFSSCHDELKDLYFKVTLAQSEGKPVTKNLSMSIEKQLLECSNEKQYIEAEDFLNESKYFITFLDLAIMASSSALFDTYLEQFDFKKSGYLHSPLDVSSLHVAATANNIEFMKKLLSKGISVNVRDSIGITPLLYANSLDSIKYLISEGADLDLKIKSEVSQACILLSHENNVIVAYVDSIYEGKCAQ